MKRTNIWYVLATLIFAFNIGCERNATNKTRISLQLPEELQEKVSGQSLTVGLKLRHVALQITAPDLAGKSFLKIIDHGDDKEITAGEIFLENIPVGDNRLIQILAAYAADESDSASIYYGDVTRSLKNSIEPVEIIIKKQGASGASTMAEVYGRYLTSSSGGPTGILNMVFKPEGKPSLPVDKQIMMAGWFRLSVFNDVPMDFVLENGTNIANQWTLSSLPPSNTVVHMSRPSGFESVFNAGSSSFQAREAGVKILGYFASNSSFLSDKKICVSEKSLLNGATMHSRYLSQANRLYALPLTHFPYGATPTYSADYISLVGGQTFAGCGALNMDDEFEKFLWIHTTDQSDNTFHEDLAGLAGLRGGFITKTHTRAVSQALRREIIEYSQSTAGEKYLEARMMPGVAASTTSVSIYENTSSAYHSSRCPHLDTPAETSGGWIFKENFTPAKVIGGLRIPATKFTDTKLYALCAYFNKAPLGEMLTFNYTDTSPIMGLAVNSATPLNYGNLGRADECRSFRVHGTGASGTLYNHRGPIGVTVQATNTSTAPVAVLHASADCSDTAMTSQNYTIQKDQVEVLGYYLAPNVDDIHLAIPASSPSLPVAGTATLLTTDDSATLQRFSLKSDISYLTNETDQLNIYANSCLPLRLFAHGNGPSGDLIRFSGSVSLSFVENDMVTAATPPSGSILVSDCSSFTPISSLTFASEKTKSFALRVGATPPTNLLLRASGPAPASFVKLNQTLPAFDHLDIIPQSASFQTGQCLPVIFRAMDGNGNAKTVSQNESIEISPASDPMAAFYTDNTCTSGPTGTITLSGGTSQVTQYYRTYGISAVPIKTFAPAANLSTSSFSMTAMAAPLIVNIPVNHSMTISSSANVQILSGAEPLTVLATVGNGSIGSVTGITGPPGARNFNINTTSTPGTLLVEVRDALNNVLAITVTVTP